MIGRPRVKALEPGVKELPTSRSIASLEEHVSNGVGGDGIGWA